MKHDSIPSPSIASLPAQSAVVLLSLVALSASSALLGCDARSSAMATGGGEVCSGQGCLGTGGTPAGGAGGAEEADSGGSGGQDDISVHEVGGTVGAGGASNAGPACLEIEVTYREPIPTVSLLIDRSLSMNGTLGFSEAVAEEVAAGTYVPWGCPARAEDPLDSQEQRFPDWRWNVVRSVLFNPDRGVVAGWEDRVRFGMALYTSYVPGSDEAVCPELRQVEAALSNRDALLEAMQCSDIGAETPTRESLVKVAETLHLTESEGSKVIILATDGAPDSCACPDFSDSSPEACRPSAVVQRAGQAMSPELAERYDLVQEAARIHREWGIAISVIDVSTPDASELHEHLRAVAQAGGGTLSSGLRPSELSTAFADLVGAARSCEVELGGTIVPGKESAGTVKLDGQVLALRPEGSGDGYRVNSSSLVELLGAACESIKAGSHALEITFPCATFEVVK